jgi:DNA modification methylase
MVLTKHTPAHIFLESFDSFPCDHWSIPQERLDLNGKSRSSIFPWRGQFSPELIELFLAEYATSDTVVLDPFVGSGTTLFEAAQKGLEGYGAEINPSAVEMASTVHFVNVDRAKRTEAIELVGNIIRTYLRPSQPDLFSYQDYINSGNQDLSTKVSDAFPKMLARTEVGDLVRNLLVNVLIRYMSYGDEDNADAFLRALKEHCKLVENLPYSERLCRILHTDARNIPLPQSSIDLIITSPPYINVFNYHQNNRPAMEILGWDLLHVAKSEVGSNRKNRQNRFMTVIQYSLDMSAALKHMHKLLKQSGRAVIVVGKESSVRGIRFKNGRLVAALAVGTAGFSLYRRQERKFKNKFGDTIYEDILHLIPTSEVSEVTEDLARSIAKLLLADAAKLASAQIRDDILDALARAEDVKQSPLFTLAPNE